MANRDKTKSLDWRTEYRYDSGMGNDDERDGYLPMGLSLLYYGKPAAMCWACGVSHTPHDGCDPVELWVNCMYPGEAIDLDELEREAMDLPALLAAMRRRGLAPEGTDGGRWVVARTVAA